MFVAAAVAAPPAEVPPDATFAADKTTLTWSPVTGSDAYNLYRGTDPGAADHACRVYRTSATEAVLDETPAPGALFHFLVSAVNADGEGTLGEGRTNPHPCVDADLDLVPDNLDNCPGAANLSQADQDDNGTGDACDPNTYDFEADLPGARPAEMTRLGPLNQTLTVKEVDGDRAVSFDEAGVGAFERFERLLAGMPFQDTTVYLDFEETAEIASIELWSEGAWGWNAGSGAIVQLHSDGGLRYYDRRGQQVPVIAGPPIPAGGRIRLHIVKGPAATSTVLVDRWNGSGWDAGWASFPVADDHVYRGRGVTLGDYLGGPRAWKRVTILHEIPGAPLTLRKDHAWSADWKVFQRDASEDATIPVRFYHRLDAPGRVEARVVVSKTGAALPGHDWSDHSVSLPAAPDGAAGALDLAEVPAGGNYDVEVRLVRDSDGAILGEGTIEEIGVGEVFLAGGQSNMSGYSGNLIGAEEPVDEVHLFGNDYLWKRAVEPMDDGTDQVDLVSSETPLHTILLRFGKEIAAATGVPVGIIPGPLGGTNLHSQWQRDPADPDNRGTLYGSLLHRGLAQNDPVPPRGFLWYQGESDVGRGDYEANLKDLIARYREDLGRPDLWFGIVQIATNQLQTDVGAWVGLQEQQRRVAETTSNVVITAAVDQPRSDTIHLNVEGYKTVGARLAAEFRERFYGEPFDASARLLSATVVGNGRRIDLVYDRDVTGGTSGLYRVFEGANPVSVTGLSVSGATITLSLGSRVAPGVTVSYGYSTAPTSAWVKDTGGTAVLCFKDVPVD